jgi:UDP-glucose 4-epimerase
VTTESRVVITGGAGFLGSVLGQRLARKGRRVLLLDNMRYGQIDNLVSDGKLVAPFLARDIRDAAFVNYLDQGDVIVHLAAISALPECEAYPMEAWAVNTAAVAHVLAAARFKRVRRFIFASTSAVYENSPKGAHTEEDPVSPDLVYSMTKTAAERLCQAAATNYGQDVMIFRFFNVYGPHQDYQRPNPPFTSYIAREAVANRECVIYNNREDVKRDYIHVDDLLRLIEIAIDDDRRYGGNVFNAGSGTAYSVPELLDVFAEVLGRTLRVRFDDPANIWHRYSHLLEGGQSLSPNRVEREVYKSAICDNRKAASHFSWQPQISIHDGLRGVIDYVRTRTKT